MIHGPILKSMPENTDMTQSFFKIKQNLPITLSSCIWLNFNL